MTKDEIISEFIKESEEINAELNSKKTVFNAEFELINNSKKRHLIDEDISRLPGSRKDAYLIKITEEIKELFIRNVIFTLQAMNFTNYAEFKKNQHNFLLNKLKTECKEEELNELLALHINIARKSLGMLDLYLEFMKKLP